MDLHDNGTMDDDDQNEREDCEGGPACPILPQSILYQSSDHSLVVIDIPRSLEESQVLPPGLPALRIVSGEAPAKPYATPEPRRDTYSTLQASSSPAAHLAELMATATAQSALRRLTSSYPGPYSLPRILEPLPDPSLPGPWPHIPRKAEHLLGSVEALRETFDKSAPSFHLVVLDPPWPNRSARRRTDKYATVSNLDEMRRLLMHIPVPSHLTPGGLVAVWVTNKHSIHDFLVSPAGLFATWGLEVVTEWTWLKVTTSGLPLYDVESAWRKPWEKLIIAKRIGDKRPEKLKPKVIVAVPDMHSRKPNLRGLFQEILGDKFRGFEVFARNLTAGWWSWGNEVLLFQQAEHWRRIDDA